MNILRRQRSLAIAFSLPLLAACAPTSLYPAIDPSLAEDEARKQRALALDLQFQRAERLATVSWPIMARNTELCGEATAYRMGVSFSYLENFQDDDYRSIARSDFQIGERITVMHVVPDSPAERAGIRNGDQLLAVAGTDLSSGKAGAASLDEALSGHTGGAAILAVDRRGSRQELTVEPIRVCDYPVLLSSAGGDPNTVNAFADGSNIHITPGMLRFASNDEELALVIGHELAHNTRDHIDAKRANRVIGTLLGALLGAAVGVDMSQAGADIGTMAHSQAFEAEADYVGTYHTARGGYDVSEAANFWRRMAAEHPGAIHLSGSSHPSTANRYLAIEQTVAELMRKREAGLPLVPEERTRQEPDGQQSVGGS